MARNYMKLHIANTLKLLTKSKDLTKITIQDITDACQINRSTFYYHFIDKDDLILWIFKNDVSSYFTDVKEKIWTQNTYYLLQVFQRDNSFYSQAVKIDSVNSLRKYLFDINYAAAVSLIRHALNGRQLSERAIDFVARFYAYALAETNIDYIKHGAKESPEKILQYYYTLAEPNIFLVVDELVAHDGSFGMYPFPDS